MKFPRAAITVFCSLALLAACRQQPSGEYLLTYASPYPPGHTFSLADREWIDAVTRKSDGRLRIKPYWSGSLITSDMSMLETRHEVADIALITPIYARGGAHLLKTQAGFYGGVRNIEDQVTVYRCLAGQYPVFDAELEGLVVLAVQGGNFPGVLTRERPIESLDDFRGLRLRVQTEATEVLRRLGADPVNMPMGEVYSALAKGVIDGVVAPADTLRSLHFSEIAKHFTTIRFPRGAYPARAMSRTVWDRLPADLQSLLLQESRTWEEALLRHLVEDEARGITYGLENGIVFHEFPPDQQRRFEVIFNEVAQDEARQLASLGIEAVPVFETAQALIAAGSPILCNEEPRP